MKIVLLNYRYFVSGGPERYMFNVKDLLEGHGHKVIPFSFAYRQNVSSPYADDFAEPPGGVDSVWFKDLGQDWRTRLRLLGKSLYNTDAKRRLKKLIRRERVDMVYALQMVNTLYPSVVDACAEEGVPIVHRLSDFQYMCANYKFFRAGRICEDCKKGSFYHGLMHRCLKGSFSVSGVRVLAMYLGRLRGSWKNIDAFVTPSQVLQQKMCEAGYPEALLHHVPTFVPSLPEVEATPGDIFLYAGAIEPFKGVFELLEAYAGLEPQQQLPLVFAGYSLGDTEDQLKRRASQFGVEGKIQWLGFQDGNALSSLYKRARAVLVPTLWYENMPNVVLESMSYGRAVIGTRLGGVAEMVVHEETGLLSKPGDIDTLRQALARLAEDPALAMRLGLEGHRRCREIFGPEVHYEQLMSVFNGVLQ